MILILRVIIIISIMIISFDTLNKKTSLIDLVLDKGHM